MSMRSFLIILLLFAIMLLFLAMGTVYVCRVIDQLYARLQLLSPDAPDPEALSEAEQYWTARRNVLRLIARRDEINAVSDALTALCAASDASDPSLCRNWHALALSALEELRRSQDLSWKRPLK